MTSRKRVSAVFWLVTGGFLTIIALCWINEFVSPFDEFRVPASDLREVLTQTGIVTLVAIPSMILISRSLNRLEYLESFLSVCAWCKKVDHAGDWIPLNEYFERKFHTETTHGICLSCAENMQAQLVKRGGAKDA